MRLKEGWQSRDAMVAYSLDVGGGMFSNSSMPAGVALEILQTANEVVLCERDGRRMLRANGREYLPAEVFDLEGEEVPEEGVGKPARGRTRRRAG